jgi:hypothetical protein
VIDVLAAANWQRGGKGPRPKPIPRPDPERERKQKAMTAKLARLGLLDGDPKQLPPVPQSDPPPPPDPIE